MSSSRDNKDDGRSSNFSPTSFGDTRASFANTSNGSMDDSMNTSGAYSDIQSTRHGGHRGGSSAGESGSDSDFYSEDDSDNSEGYADGAGHVAQAAQRSTHQRHGASRGDFLRGVNGSPGGASGHDGVSSPNSRQPGSPRRHRGATADAPVSYFHRHHSGAFSVKNELRCYMAHLRHLFRAIEEDRLPWKEDFADIHKLRFPRKMKEVAGRLNLNIPYYASNYIEVFYVVTMPFLFLYNTPFFLVAFITMVMIHSVTMRRKNTQVYGEAVTILGRPVSYRNMAHLLLFALVMLFMFFNGLRTMLWVVVLNVCVIVPHALIRKPTYFDDEELEKCRPKLAQYAIVLLLLALDYLEGDVKENDDTESRRLVERERKRLATVLEKREGKD